MVAEVTDIDHCIYYYDIVIVFDEGGREREEGSVELKWQSHHHSRTVPKTGVYTKHGRTQKI
ncbi:hypothetical protein BYT27DRAFT_7191176 [Phlegmacium glaucopus]|nr:hypothetical protein BYT27DRAFT_7191176 [Phlegmacium glaucopus]